MENSTQWDYAIVGAGSSGCALAYQLAKSSPEKSILILEAGRSDRSLFIKLPATVSRAIAAHDWGYLAQADPSRYGVRERWIRGKVLGGSSSINGTIYVRGAAGDFDRWSSHMGGQGGWSAPEVMPVFREFEKSDQLSPLRGRLGRMWIRTIQRPHPLTHSFIESAWEAGYPFNPDYNERSQEGVSLVQFTQRRGLRWSSADAFLKPILGKSNVKLLLDARVDRVELVDGRASGLVFRKGGRRRQVAARDVILCAGAINSPQLLMLSGIGARQELMSHDIKVEVDLPGVGCNLRDHQYLYLVYRVNTPTHNLTQGPLQKVAIAKEFLCKGEGPISNLVESIGFVRSRAESPAPDIQIFFQPMGSLRGPDGNWELASYPAVGVVLANSYPLSTGRVRLATGNPDDAPIIEYSLLDREEDVDAMLSGIQVIRRIMRTKPMAGFVEEEVMPGSAVEDRTGLETFIRTHTSICKHSVGTCRMGIDKEAVVNPELLVRGTKNLWVADASVMPDTMSANTNAACIMIGAKLGKQLSARKPI